MDKITEIENPANEEGFKDKLLNVFALTPEQEILLKGRIEKWNGVVRIFVHPFFDDHRNRRLSRTFREYTSAYSKNISRIDEIKDILFKILELSEDKTPPTVIFEEVDFLDEFGKKLYSQNINRQSVVLVPTFPGASVPYVQRVIDSPYYTWIILNEILKKLGVKKMIVGGMFFEVNSKDEVDRGIEEYEKCVGGAINEFRKNFDIEISSLSFPHKRQDDIHNQGSIKK